MSEKDERWFCCANLKKVDEENFKIIKKRWEELSGKKYSQAKVIKRLLAVIAITPEYDILFQEGVLFKVNPEEMQNSYKNKLIPVLQNLMNVIEDIQKGEGIDD